MEGGVFVHGSSCLLTHGRCSNRTGLLSLRQHDNRGRGRGGGGGEGRGGVEGNVLQFKTVGRSSYLIQGGREICRMAIIDMEHFPKL